VLPQRPTPIQLFAPELLCGGRFVGSQLRRHAHIDVAPSEDSVLHVHLSLGLSGEHVRGDGHLVEGGVGCEGGSCGGLMVIPIKAWCCRVGIVDVREAVVRSGEGTAGM
jgi:hypothetical protein